MDVIQTFRPVLVGYHLMLQLSYLDFFAILGYQFKVTTTRNADKETRAAVTNKSGPNMSQTIAELI